MESIVISKRVPLVCQLILNIIDMLYHSTQEVLSHSEMYVFIHKNKEVALVCNEQLFIARIG